MNEYFIWLWFVVGIVLILLEITVIPGIGLMFIGFGALTTSVLLYIYPAFISYQIALIGLISLAWFLVLWKPLKKFVYTKHGTKSHAKGYSDLIGSEVTVVLEIIEPGKTGQVTWSGTIMNARLDESEEFNAEIGEKLYIIEVKGNTLVCSKRAIGKS